MHVWKNQTPKNPELIYMIVLQLVMRDTGGPTAHKPATAGTETEAVTL